MNCRCVTNQNYFQLQNAWHFILSIMKEFEYFFIGEISDGENAVNSVNTFFINGNQFLVMVQDVYQLLRTAEFLII